MKVLWLLVFAFSCIRLINCIPLSRFYPFGTVAGDLSLPRFLDGFSEPINLTVTFPFFDQNHDEVIVNNNGMVSFESGVGAFFATPFPLNGTQELIAVYWTDVDTRPAGSGTVWYRETTDVALLRRFRDEIRRAFPTQRIFSPISLFIATWDHVGYYDLQFDRTNTFQCVMGTDGIRSFVVYLYADGEIQWAISEDINSLPAQVGFNAGDGIRFFAVPESRMPEIINITTTSNVDIPGVWMFRVDQEDIMNAGCTDNSDVALTLVPRLGTVLGGTPIRLLGPCFEENDNITCQFNDITVEGKYVNEDLALCVSPEIQIVGQVVLHLTVVRSSGTTSYIGEATFHFVSFDDVNEVNIVDSAPVLKCAVPLSLEWLPEFFFPVNIENATSAKVDIDLYRYNKAARPPKWQKMIVLATDIPNAGNATVEIPKSVLVQDPQLVVIKISLSSDQTVDIVDQRIAGWSDLAYSESMDGTLSKLCLVWSIEQADDVGEILLGRLPPCPPNVRLAVLDSLYLEDRQISIYREFFHPNASRCFRQATLTRENQGSGQQCCYFSDGTLIVGVPSGGNVDMVAPRSNELDSILNHQFDDVLPYIYCCKGRFSKCDMYYNKRPSDNGRNYEVTPPACVYGDPHIVTLDGYKYTFNGKGEFTLIETPDNRFTLQARMVEATGVGGDAVQATVFSALVGKQNDSDTVQLELSRRGIDARVNGMRVDFEDVVQQSFNNVTLFDVGNRTIEAIFSSGVLISAKEENGIISVLLVSLSNSYLGSTRGLMGIFNGNTSDDLIPKGNSEPISLNSSLETIHRSFGITWIINNSVDSLFDYHEAGESWSTYYDPDFTPLFGAEFSDPAIETEAMELCQGDEFCLYDFATTGSMDIGLSTLNGSVSYEEMVETARPIICNPTCVNGACIANDTCQCAMGYTGQICTEPVYIECDVNPCENNGTCQSLAGSYICNCSRGFSGLFCEQNVTFSFERDHYTVNEEGGRVELCILQNGESIIDLSIFAAPQEFTAEGAIDYISSPVSVQFNQTDDKRCFHITIIDDFKREITETFEVVLLPNTGVTLIDPSVATVSIIDDDTNRKHLSNINS